ncbi:DUF262 domain-containing protein [Butyricimonas paravirosa]|uniref:DUF262 domain-containing protein n=1 Tax=Butyricimonas paravirosa TaxID=1472417 RepID=UPI0024331A59|nr:DUF262 domain-containing protein [Butyricimonas paravirosa]
MKMTPRESTISSILNIKNRQYEIPRFQREYSWEKKHYKEFLEDMISNINIKEDEIEVTQYFMGTMLFVGDKDKPSKEPVYVVDGQQRLTTVTILFSAIAQIFKKLGNSVLANSIFEYIMTKNVDGEGIRVLKTVSSYPYFSFYIQSLDKGDANQPISEEEIKIKETYDFFVKNLREDNLRQLFKKTGKDFGKFSHIALLKAIRDQVLAATVIEIITEDKKEANRLFEILNSKGKGLSNIDMIKNKIFEELNTVEPADFASEKWKNINNILNCCNEGVGFATFLRHYFSSKYKSVSKANLYDKFKELIKIPEYKDFLKDLEDNAIIYKKIVSPQRQDYDNRKEYFWLVQTLDVFNKVFNIVNIRVPFLSLLEAKERDVITTRVFKNIVLYIENFHFAYTAVLSKGTNRVENHYSTFAIKLRKSRSKNETSKIVDELKRNLESLFPTYNDFQTKFVTLIFSKKDNPSNMKTKYAINRLNCYFEHSELFDERGSVEHILPENEGLSLNIGNLILLENNLNVEAGNGDYKSKKPIYSKSKYKWVNDFLANNVDWMENSVNKRAETMAQIYYEKIFGRHI